MGPEDDASRSLVSRGSAAYADIWWLRAAVNAIPYVGGSVDILFSHRGEALVKERVTELIGKLSWEIRLLSVSKLDRSYLDSDECFDLLRKAIERSSRIRDRERIHFIARIVAGAISKEIYKVGDPEVLVDVLSELNEAEALVVSKLKEMYRLKKTQVEDWGRPLESSLPENFGGQLPFLMKRIERTGLLSEMTGAIIGYGGGTFQLTDTARRLFEFLDESAPLEGQSDGLA